ncbi:hypothetical protein CLV58_109254 [Spirosoma oryzae]|uniref:Uncharacterized protein n=1 Tax=Spirosoma oryzae TaxID=1469603 RepID=A0A2T0SYP1_9BACT|nr:hypothetical protein [Spirosoma oryzae]PRY38527.1 hypothetical protein CLV58_109254 [Spirosoma oryzae]
MIQSNEISHLIGYLLKTELTVEEAMLLYTIYIQKESPDPALIKQLTQYYGRFMYYDQKGQPIGIPWSRIIHKLADEGYLITYPGYNRPGPTGNFKLHLECLDVTEKFKSTILDSDREKWWDYFVKLYGYDMIINGQSIMTTLPEKGQTLDDVKELFWNVCGQGSMYKIGELMEITDKWLEYFPKNIKINRYLESFDAIKMAVLQKESEADKSWTGSY